MFMYLRGTILLIFTHLEREFLYLFWEQYTYLSKSVKRLTLNVCCLSSLYPSAFLTASRAWVGAAYSRKMYLWRVFADP